MLLRSDVVTLHIDTDYMMELLDPTQLQGEGKADTINFSASKMDLTPNCDSFHLIIEI